MAKDKAIVASAGVHYTAYQLSCHGYDVGVTAPGVEAVDLLASNPKNGNSIAIQIKTATDAHRNSQKWGPYSAWRVGRKLATSPPPNLWIMLVDIPSDPQKTQHVFIVPPNKLQLPVEVERFGSPPEDFWCNIYDKDEAQYKDRWDIVGQALGSP